MPRFGYLLTRMAKIPPQLWNAITISAQVFEIYKKTYLYNIPTMSLTRTTLFAN
jgi:hypothetical protein